jgi:hypothetical protein
MVPSSFASFDAGSQTHFTNAGLETVRRFCIDFDNLFQTLSTTYVHVGVDNMFQTLSTTYVRIGVTPCLNPVR